MIKKSSKVLSMVMAFSMAASVFVAPNAFAAFDAKSPVTAKVKTVFLEKNANNVYEENKNTGNAIATVVYSDGSANIESPDGLDASSKLGKFKIGETYKVTITQTSKNAAVYTINSAKIGVDLKTAETNGSAYYNEYVKDVALTKTTSGTNTVYTGSFTAFGAADKILSTSTDDGATVSDMSLYIDFETKISSVTAVAGSSTNATVKPLDADLNEVASTTLKPGQDAYFRVTANNGYYIDYSDASKVQAKAYTNGSTTAVTSSEKNLTLDTSKGLDIYKLSAENVNAIIGSAGSNGTVKVAATATAMGNTSNTVSLSDDLKNSGNYTITYADGTPFPGSARKGKVLKITSTAGNIDSITFKDNPDVKVYYSGSTTASFIANGANLEITAINAANTTSTKALKLNDLEKVQLVGGSANTITATSGLIKQVAFKPASGMYPNLTNSEEYKIPYTTNGWEFDFLGVIDGNLVYNVKFGTADCTLNLSSAIATANTLRYPSVTNKFVPAVEFDQMIGTSGGTNPTYVAYVNLSAVGTNGVVTVNNTNTTVTVNYDSASLKIDYINLAGTKLTTSGTTKIDTTNDKNGTMTATAKFKITKAVDDNGKGLLLNFDADYQKGNIDIEETENGTIIAATTYSNPQPITRQKAGEKTYLIATPKAGYKLSSIVVKDEVTGEKISLTKTVSDNIYYMTMPNVNITSVSGTNYGDSVVVTATFVKDSSIVLVNNLVPEADKANNNGYAKTSFGTATQITAGKEFTVEYVANDNCKLLSTSIQYKNAKDETVTLKATSVDGNKYTYTAPTDANGTMSISAKFAKTSDIIKVENKTAEADKKTNNGYVTVDASEVVAGDTINGTVTAVEGYKVTGVSYSYTNSDKKTVTNDVTVKENAFSITVPKDVIADGAISIEAKFEKSSEEAKKDAWVKDGDNWTYWKDGKQVTGWFQDGGNDWFYCDPKTGLMVTGWFQDGGNDWFYCDVVTGAMKTGWFQDGGSTWYYCFTQEDASQRGNRAGVMAANQWVLSNGNWYYLEESGAMATNKWVKDADDALLSWVGETGAFLYTE